MVSCLTVMALSVWLGWLAVSAPREVRRQWLGLQTGFWEHGGCCLLLGTILVTREEHFHRSVRQIMSPLQPWHMSAVSTPSVGASSSDSVHGRVSAQVMAAGWAALARGKKDVAAGSPHPICQTQSGSELSWELPTLDISTDCGSSGFYSKINFSSQSGKLILYSQF